jgi:hypothetical protein
MTYRDASVIFGWLHEITKRPSSPEPEALAELLELATQTMKNMPESMRPRDSRSLPGGLVELGEAEYHIIIPDLHGRMDFLLAVLKKSLYGSHTIFEDLFAGRVNIICVGDAFHSEIRGRDRWIAAYDEFLEGFKQSRNMDEEMRENLGLLEMIALLKIHFPFRFFFLKGNHENIANERGEGNYPFRKFASEGEMVKHWVLKFMGEEVFNRIYEYEKALAVMTVGKDFLVTHCEPARVFQREEIIDCYAIEDVIYGLTWVDNGQAENGSVEGTLNNFFGPNKHARIFGGHRPVLDKFSLRQNGRYVQINTPNKWVVGLVSDMIDFRPKEDIVQISGVIKRGVRLGAKVTRVNR